MRGNGSLSARQGALIAALLAAPSLADACRELGLPESTAHRWLKDPIFDAAYRTAKAACLGQAIGRVQALAASAVEVLQQVMEDTDTPAAVRVQAAAKVLDVAMKAAGGEQVEERIAALEVALHGDFGPRAIA